MSILDSRYRGSTAYFDVYKRLVHAARAGKLVTYKPLIAAMKLKPGNYAQREVGHMLGEINEDVRRARLPMLSAIVVNAATHQPGPGFFELAVTMGQIPPGLSETQCHLFWRAEVKRVFAAAWPDSASSFLFKRPAPDS